LHRCLEILSTPTAPTISPAYNTPNKECSSTNEGHGRQRVRLDLAACVVDTLFSCDPQSTHAALGVMVAVPATRREILRNLEQFAGCVGNTLSGIAGGVAQSLGILHGSYLDSGFHIEKDLGAFRLPRSKNMLRKNDGKCTKVS
jgi:hypothetical protein